MSVDEKIVNIFKQEVKDKHIFKDRTVFDINYFPSTFKFRDPQMSNLAANIKPAVNEGRAINTLIMGNYATGKTTAVKKVFEIATDICDDVYCVYVNCKTYNSCYKVYSIIFKEIFAYNPPTKGISSTILFDRIMTRLTNENKALVVALDDVNYLFRNKQGFEVFYTLLRAYETFDVRVSIFPIVSELDFDYTLPQNVKSVFAPQQIIFPEYDFEEMYRILKDRCCAGFCKGVIDADVLYRVTEITAEAHNLRLGLDLLRSLGYAAEFKCEPEISDELLGEIIKNIR